ncbi:MAG: FAD-dependent oxidoreductase [Desulfobulbaceae bacterium]|nr:FAD-dependent oxidoreductase [Desulfobulbaceae bacterium]
MNYTIVGGGIAAVTALKAISEYDPECQITVISEEKHCFYYRPMTPLIIKGDKERDDLLHDHEGIGHINLIHDRATSLDADNCEVTLQGGQKVGYDRLLIATGSSPLIPQIPGVGEKNVHYLRTLKDAMGLREAAKIGQQAVIMGGGYVGIKKAEALAHQGIDVTLVEKEEHILLPRLDAQGAALVAEKLAARGVNLIMKDTIVEIKPEAKGVKLASGIELEADFVCIAVGVRPNIDWLRGSGIEMEKAIVVNELMQTTRDGIYAAGDVVQIKDLVTGNTVVSALWTNAVEMGKVAGVNMAGGRIKYPGGLEVLNASEIEGIPIVSIGHVLADDKNGLEVYRSQHQQNYMKLAMRDDVLTGAIFIGNIENAGIYTALIKTGKPLGPLKEKAINRSLNYADFYASH